MPVTGRCADTEVMASTPSSSWFTRSAAQTRAGLGVLLVLVAVVAVSLLGGRDTTSASTSDYKFGSVPGPQAAERQVSGLLKEIEVEAWTYASDYAALPHSLKDLAEYGVEAGEGDGVSFETTDEFGYCALVWNKWAAEHDSKETALRFDSVTTERLEPGERPRSDGACGKAA